MPSCPFSSVSDWVLLNYDADFISSIKEYILHSGDRAVLSELWPCLKRVTGFLTRFEMERARAFDDYISDGMTSKAATYLNVLWGLNDMRTLADWQGDSSLNAQIDCCRERLRETVRKEFYDLATGWFFEPIDDGERKTSWVINSYAVLAGMLDGPAAAKELLQRVTADPDTVRPNCGWGQFWALTAMLDNGLKREAVEYIRRMWGQLLDCGLTTCIEGLPPNLAEYLSGDEHRGIGSCCHGWTAGPCYLLPTYVLGVRPEAIGFERIAIRPFLGDLQWAEGTVPTPLGDIFIRWEKEPRLRGQVFLPDSISGVVSFPDGRPIATVEPGWHVLE